MLQSITFVAMTFAIVETETDYRVPAPDSAKNVTRTARWKIDIRPFFNGLITGIIPTNGIGY